VLIFPSIHAVPDLIFLLAVFALIFIFVFWFGLFVWCRLVRSDEVRVGRLNGEKAEVTGGDGVKPLKVKSGACCAFDYVAESVKTGCELARSA
jgi:uncharacterized membrane protein YqiK